MDVLLLSVCLITSVTVLVWHSGDAALQFTAPPPTCPCDTITFECTVGGDTSGVTLWRVGGGGGSCSLFHSNSIATSTCGPGNVFVARFENTNATSFPSTLSATATPALNGTSIKCFGPTFPGTIVGSNTIQIVGPPLVPTLFCVGISEDSNGAVNVTVNWTLSGGDNADFYLIDITTNDPDPPYRGLLNTTAVSVTQRELTGFQAGYEYNITVRGVNCGSQVGSGSGPLTITPQVPVSPLSDICAVYDKVNQTLQAIQSTWEEVDPVTISGDCANGHAIRSSYEIAYISSSGISITTCVVNGTDCSNGVCHHQLQNNTADSRCQPPVSQFNGENVTITLKTRNIVGRSIPAVLSKTSVMNAIFRVSVDTTNPENASVVCTFEPGYICTIDYGTDSPYSNLDYRDNSTTLGQVATIALTQTIQRDVTYYFIVSAESNSQCVRVRGTFRTECTELDLGIAAAEDVTTDPRCVHRLFMNSSSIINGVVCYNGTTAMSEAIYICDDNIHLMGEATRVCQSEGMWNGSTPQCFSTDCACHIVVGVTFGVSLVIFMVFTLILTYIILGLRKRVSRSVVIRRRREDEIHVYTPTVELE